MFLVSSLSRLSLGRRIRRPLESSADIRCYLVGGRYRRRLLFWLEFQSLVEGVPCRNYGWPCSKAKYIQPVGEMHELALVCATTIAQDICVYFIVLQVIEFQRTSKFLDPSSRNGQQRVVHLSCISHPNQRTILSSSDALNHCYNVSFFP